MRDGILHTKHTLLDHHHCNRGDQGFSHRCQTKQRIFCHGRATCRIQKTMRLKMHKLIAMQNGRDCTRKHSSLDLSLHHTTQVR